MKLRDLLNFVGNEETQIEKLRNQLCAIQEFEPYTAFMRIDKEQTGFIDGKNLEKYMSANGYADQFTPEDYNRFLSFFDLDNDLKLKYHDWLQVCLTCEDQFLRAAASQRQSRVVDDELSTRIERAMSMLLFKEIQLHAKWEELKH